MLLLCIASFVNMWSDTCKIYAINMYAVFFKCILMHGKGISVSFVQIEAIVQIEPGHEL